MEINLVEEYVAFVEDYHAFLNTVFDTQKKHLEALLTHDIATIDASTARQQAVVMQLKGYEETRVKKQTAAGLPSELTLELVAGRLEGRLAQRMRVCLEKLRATTGEIDFINNKIKQTAETNLRVINIAVPVELRKEAQRYHEDGRQSDVSGSSAFFGTKV